MSYNNFPLKNRKIGIIRLFITSKHGEFTLINSATPSMFAHLH